MKIHEYQAKAILAKYAIPVLKGGVATTVPEAVKAAESLTYPVVVKAQIHAGGRGKGGGVKLAKDRSELEAHSKAIIGMNLVTHQTGPEGRRVKTVLIEQGCAIDKELYLAVLLDRSTAKLVMMASAAGGMDIEEVAEKTPEKIVKVQIDPTTGLADHQARQLGFGIGLSGAEVKAFAPVATALYKSYIAEDLSLAEINPLVITKDGKCIALDAKLNIDDNALYRHPDTREMRDKDEEDPLEVEASDAGLNYIKLDGNVGCMVNGAGLAMATMDIIQLAGAAPANFLDVGGGASQETVSKAFGIILKDPNVKAILINIFGGIVRCDRVANGVIAAAKGLSIKLPIVIRLAGTNAKEAAELLASSGLSFKVATDLKQAAAKITEALKA